MQRECDSLNSWVIFCGWGRWASAVLLPWLDTCNKDLVDERGWMRKEDYVEGLALAQLAPGPLAAQLAIYLGYIRAGLLGATAVGVAFVLPSFLMVLGTFQRPTFALAGCLGCGACSTELARP